MNAQDIADGLLALQVSTWTYDWEPDSVTHLGPMAQDFAAAFGLGTDDKTIAFVDYCGVLTVAVQVLAARVRELEARANHATPG